MDSEKMEEGGQASSPLLAKDEKNSKKRNGCDEEKHSGGGGGTEEVPLVRVTSSSERSLPRAVSQGSLQAGAGGSEPPPACTLSAPALTKRNVAHGSNGEVKGSSSEKMQDLCGASSGHRVCLEEYAPSASSVKTTDWRMSLTPFSSKKWDKKEENNLSRQVKRYYKTQNELITAFEELQLEVDDVMEQSESNTQRNKKASLLAKISFFCNLLLLIAKVVASVLTGSLSVVSSAVDSAVDLVSGALMWWSGRAMKRRNIYQYPQGRTKLEPISIIILSVVMALASIQIIRESIEVIIEYARHPSHGPTFGISSIVICCTTIVVKLILFLVCRRIRTPSADALSQDHRNDVLSNTMAVTCGLLGDRVLSFIDPIGAIVISLYILVSWYQTGSEQIKMLTGHTARPDFMKKITWLALNHHPSIHLIDTVRAFHFGQNFLVEVDIVLPEDMDLKTSHDIGESLQMKIERLPEVERAFVHLDYETDHSPYSEHKQV